MNNSSKCFTEILSKLNEAEKKQQRILDSIVRIRETLNKAVVYNDTLRIALKANKKSQINFLQSKLYKASQSLPMKRLRELN